MSGIGGLGDKALRYSGDSELHSCDYRMTGRIGIVEYEARPQLGPWKAHVLSRTYGL